MQYPLLHFIFADELRDLGNVAISSPVRIFEPPVEDEHACPGWYFCDVRVLCLNTWVHEKELVFLWKKGSFLCEVRKFYLSTELLILFQRVVWQQMIKVKAKIGHFMLGRALVFDPRNEFDDPVVFVLSYEVDVGRGLNVRISLLPKYEFPKRPYPAVVAFRSTQ
jgi:hypothetical protein